VSTNADTNGQRGTQVAASIVCMRAFS
jgi:hypothetical protein